MKSKELQFIEAIASNCPNNVKELKYIKDVLEDGEALSYLGVTDEDTEMVENAHSLLTEWMNKGYTYLHQVS